MITNINDFTKKLQEKSIPKTTITETVGTKDTENKETTEDPNEENFVSELDKILAIGRK